MKKQVVAIIAVALVQGVFVGYTMLQSPLSATIAPVLNASPFAPIDLADLEIPDPLTAPAAESAADATPSNQRRVIKTRFAARKGIYARTATPRTTFGKLSAAATHRPKEATPKFPFETIVIRYNGRPEPSETFVADAHEPKKRSQLAKVGRVLKMPWKWVSAIGSKLN